MTILKPNLSILSPKKIGSQLNQMDTNTSRTNHDNASNNSSSANNSRCRNNLTNNNSHHTSQHISNLGGQSNCNVSNLFKPNIKRLEIENNDLKKKVSSFDQEKRKCLKMLR